MPIRALIAAISALLSVAGVRAAEAPPTQEITVYGRIIHDAPRLVEQFGQPSDGERLARWRRPICVDVSGLEPQRAQWIAARIKDIAEAVGAPVEDGACVPNLIVVVAKDDVAMRGRLAARANAAFRGADRWPLDKVQLAAFEKTDGAPAHIFYSLGTAVSVTGAETMVGDAGTAQYDTGILGAPTVSGYASRLVPMTEPSLSRVFLVLDGRQLVGRSPQQIAAYAAVTALAQVRIAAPLHTPASITALFQDEKDGLAAPNDLTIWDHAYLTSLYATDSQINLSMQQSFLADQLAKVVRAEAKAAAPPPNSP